MGTDRCVGPGLKTWLCLHLNPKPETFWRRFKTWLLEVPHHGMRQPAEVSGSCGGVDRRHGTRGTGSGERACPAGGDRTAWAWDRSCDEMFASNPGAEVVAVCDVDEATFERPIKIVQKQTGKAPRVEKDFRRLLDDKTIDAVTIATPDHWHALHDRDGVTGGQGRLCGEAGQPQRRRGAANGRGRPEV